MACTLLGFNMVPNNYAVKPCKVFVNRQISHPGSPEQRRDRWALVMTDLHQHHPAGLEMGPGLHR
ncbi:MAG TPA: hypothetical protein VL133_17220, partial [Devosia sp.]|nr:hypothetical protein [Devosia sp.]